MCRSTPLPMGVNSTSFGSPRVRPMGVHRTCGEPNEIKKNAHPKDIAALVREQELAAQHPRVPNLWRAGQDYLMCGQVGQVVH